MKGAIRKRVVFGWKMAMIMAVYVMMAALIAAVINQGAYPGGCHNSQYSSK